MTTELLNKPPVDEPTSAPMVHLVCRLCLAAAPGEPHLALCRKPTFRTLPDDAQADCVVCEGLSKTHHLVHK